MRKHNKANVANFSGATGETLDRAGGWVHHIGQRSCSRATGSGELYSADLGVQLFGLRVSSQPGQMVGGHRRLPARPLQESDLVKCP